MPVESQKEKSARAKKILAALHKVYPEAKCSLDYKNSVQLLIATILSAQCTDVRVNMTTPALFQKYKTLQDFAAADLCELEGLIRSTGFYKNKAKNIKACAAALIEGHGGEIPRTVEELSALPGVGRKTANVVLGNAFGIPALVVDTHVTRLSNRMSLAKGENAVKLEQQLIEVIDKSEWTDFAHLLIHHGRAICVARTPRCTQCVVNRLCPKKGVKSFK